MPFKIESRVSAVISRTRSACLEAASAVAARAAARAEAKAPRDTGELAGSIGFEAHSSGSQVEVVVGAEADYSPHVELGTDVMSPQPYLAPAMEPVPGELADELSRRMQ